MKNKWIVWLLVGLLAVSVLVTAATITIAIFFLNVVNEVSSAIPTTEEPSGRIDLSGQWKFEADPSKFGEAKGYHKVDFDDKAWKSINIPIREKSAQEIIQKSFEMKQDEGGKTYSGYIWYRKKVTIPAEWVGKTIFLNFGQVADKLDIYINGNPSGGGMAIDGSWSIGPPSSFFRFGKPNIITLRVERNKENGGLLRDPISLTSSQSAFNKPEDYTAGTQSEGQPTGAIREVSVTGRDAIIEEGETVSDVIVVGGHAIIRGHVTGDVSTTGGDIIVEPTGVVDGDANAIGGRIVLSPGGIIRGDQVSFGGDWGGKATKIVHGDFLDNRISWYSFLQIIFFALLAAVIVALFPERMEKVAETTLKRPGLSAIYGIVGLLLIIPVAVLLAVTIIGIPLIFVEFILVVGAWVVGAIGIGLALGRKLGDAVHKPVQSAVLAAVVGIIILELVRWAPIAGDILVLVLYMIGSGAVWITAFGGYDNWWAQRFSRRNAAPVRGTLPIE